jgi:hypothetical protein
MTFLNWYNVAARVAIAISIPAEVLSVIEKHHGKEMGNRPQELDLYQRANKNKNERIPA